MIEYIGQISFGSKKNQIVLTGRRRVTPIDKKFAQQLVTAGIGAWDGEQVYYSAPARVHLLDGTAIDVPDNGMIDVDISLVKSLQSFADATANLNGPAK